MASDPSASSSSPLRQPPLRRPSLRVGQDEGIDTLSPAPEHSRGSSPAPSTAQSEPPHEPDSNRDAGAPSRLRSRGSLGRRSLGGASSNNSAISSSTQPGTFLTRFLGSFRPPSASPARPPLPRSLSSPMHLQTDAPADESEPSPTGPPSSFLPVPGGFPASPAPSNSSTTSLAKRFTPSFRRTRSQAGSPKASPNASPAASPGLASEPPRLSPGSPATLRGQERDPMERAMEHLQEGSDGDSTVADRRGGGMLRRGSVLSQMTVQAHDHAYPAGTPLLPISEPPTSRPPQLESSLELIATLLPPALLLLSQLGPTHLFSPPLELPSLFQTTLAAAASRKSSVSSASGTSAVLSSSASISSVATGSTTASTSFSAFHLPTTDHLIPSHTHELHAPSTLSVPTVSAAAVWRLFRGFEWIGEVGKGEQPLPPSPIPPSLGGSGGGPPLEVEDEPEQVFDFPALLQGVADVLAADAAARGIELVIGQVGSGGAPSPAATPGLMSSKAAQPPLEGVRQKSTESRELLVRADERAWSVTLIWILHHILAGATSGSNIDVRFVATAATPESPSDSRSSSPEPESVRPSKWWTVSVEIVHTIPPPVNLAPPFPEESTAPPAPAPLPSPPFETPFAQSLFSLVPLNVGNGPFEPTYKSWLLEALLPAANPRTQSIAEDPSSLLGRRRASLEVSVGQEPSMSDLKRFAETALKGHKVALHAGETSTFAKHLTTYLAGWGMDVQHVPIERETLSSGSHASTDPKRPLGGSRFDSGFETAGPSPTGTDPHGKSPELGATSATANGEPASSLVIIDDDVPTLRRLLLSLRAPPLHYAPTLLAKRPQLSSRRTRSSPHVRQLHQVQQHSNTASQWVIVHFASLTHYKSIKEIVQDTLATSRSPNLPEVLVVPKPAGPRRIITAIWTALKRPAVDPSLPPIATSPTSPGIQYWTPRLSPALAKESDFDFSTDSSASKAGDAPQGATLGKPRTPPIYFNAAGQPISTGLPPSPLGRMSETQDSYFSSVTEELKDATPSEGMIIQSPDGRSGIFFQPQPRSTKTASGKEKVSARGAADREKSSAGEDIPEEGAFDESPLSPPQTAPGSNDSSAGPPSRVSTFSPHEMGLGSSTLVNRRVGSGSSSTSSSGPPTSSIPPSTPALALDSFIHAVASGRPLTEPEEGPLGEALSRTVSNNSGVSRGNPAPSRRSSGSANSVGSASNATSPRASQSGSNPLFSPVRRSTASASPVPTLASTAATPGPAGQAGAAAAQALASSTPTSPGQGGRGSRRGTITGLPKNKRRVSRRNTIPAVPPISVLIVEDNPINQTILSVFMKKKGISYKVAKDGEQAVQMWKKGNFHLVLMDIQLPVKDGIEATREIREMERQNNIGTFITTPTSDLNSPMSSISNTNPLSAPTSPLLNMPVIIVALTASSLQADRINALAAGCNDFLTKPVSLTWLESKLVEWGSMAYLSGFSRKSESSEGSVAGASRAVTPARPLSPATIAPGFKEGLATQADRISAHLHIERPPGSRSSSPGLPHPEALSPITSPESSPPSGPDATAPLVNPATRALNPVLTFTKPTPHDTPRPVPAIPGATATPAPAAGGDAKPTLDAVQEKLEGLIAGQKGATSVPTLPQRPGPTPLAPSVLQAAEAPALEDVVAEGNRLIEAGRSRAGSASFSQAIIESGVSTASNSTRNSAENLSKGPPPPSE